MDPPGRTRTDLPIQSDGWRKIAHGTGAVTEFAVRPAGFYLGGMRAFSLVLALCLAGLTPAPADTQAGGTEPAEWTGTHVVEVRWLHGEQLPGVTRFQRASMRLRLDSAAVAGDRLYWFRAEGRGGRRGALRIPAGGGPLEAWIEPPDLSRGILRGSPVFRHSSLESQLTLRGAAMLDDTRLWHVAPLVVPALRPGATATHTLDLRVERFGFIQTMAGPQVITLERDTLVDGRRLWVGRDRARVRYHERVLAPRRSLDTVVVIDRAAEAILRGRFLYDPELGLFRARADTLTGTGTATLRLPDGREFRTPASYERRSDWTLRTPAEQLARDGEEQRRQRAESFSIVPLPRTPLEERLASGDTAAADSLLRTWTSAGPGDRARIAAMIRGFGPAPARDRLDSLRLEAGGWLARVRAATHDVWAGPPIDSATMVEYIRLLRDPGIPHAHGLSPDPAYENLAGGLAMYPPSLGAPPDRTSCTPAACRLLLAERDAAEPRLRQVAMVASFILDPERWADSLLSRRDTATHLLHDAVMLARGVGATWPAAEKRAIPPEGAGWQEWLRWTGTDREPGRNRGTPLPIRFRDTHRYAVAMIERIRGRDIGAELAAAADTVRSDSGRMVLRTLALHLGAIRPTLDDVVSGLRSRDDGERRLALIGLRRLDSAFVAADSALRHEIVGQLLDQVLDQDSIWAAGPGLGLPRPLDRDASADDERPIYLSAGNVPQPLVDRWRAEGLEVITREQWRAQPPRSPGVLLRVGPTTTLGPLVRISITWSVREPRAPDQGPRGWARGASYLLLRTGDRWVIVSTSGWIT